MISFARDFGEAQQATLPWVSESPQLYKTAGGALTSDIIACKTRQKNFDDTMAPAVGEGFAWLRNLFDIFARTCRRSNVAEDDEVSFR